MKKTNAQLQSELDEARGRMLAKEEEVSWLRDRFYPKMYCETAETIQNSGLPPNVLGSFASCAGIPPKGLAEQFEEKPDGSRVFTEPPDHEKIFSEVDRPREVSWWVLVFVIVLALTAGYIIWTEYHPWKPKSVSAVHPTNTPVPSERCISPDRDKWGNVIGVPCKDNGTFVGTQPAQQSNTWQIQNTVGMIAVNFSFSQDCWAEFEIDSSVFPGKTYPKGHEWMLNGKTIKIKDGCPGMIDFSPSDMVDQVYEKQTAKVEVVKFSPKKWTLYQ